jgi:hypothetical protein
MSQARSSANQRAWAKQSASERRGRWPGGHAAGETGRGQQGGPTDMKEVVRSCHRLLATACDFLLATACDFAPTWHPRDGLLWLLEGRPSPVLKEGPPLVRPGPCTVRLFHHKTRRHEDRFDPGAPSNRDSLSIRLSASTQRAAASTAPPQSSCLRVFVVNHSLVKPRRCV